MMFGWFEMALADQDLTQPASASALRVKEFLAQAAAIVQLDDQTASAWPAARSTSDKAFELLWLSACSTWCRSSTACASRESRTTICG